MVRPLSWREHAQRAVHRAQCRSGFPTVQDPVATATSPESAKRLWELSEDLTGVHYHLPVTA
ncbi:MAG TPA: hypothetical protein VFC19_00490 [Candidatus Limnocylindrales bacterium]|nr:hypothetical protein [Candidatus Limnocylindrales bacterium]